MRLERLNISIVLLLFSFLPVQTLFKMTNVHCESFNASWSVFKQCRLRAIRRNVTILNINMLLLQPVRVVHVNSLVRTKSTGGYKPFVINATFDCCEFMVKHNNVIGGLVYGLFKDYSNINHTCPFEGEQIVKGFYLRHDLFKLPMAPGEYVLELTWYLHKAKAFITNIFFTFTPE